MATSDSDIFVNVVSTPTDDGRVNALKQRFFDEFQQPAKFLVRVPGRVNLIGEHIDYCGYPVLPMAIEQTILCAAIPTNDDVLLLKNFNDKYESYQSSINAFEISVPNDGTGPKWFNYFLCGIKGILENLSDKVEHLGMKVMVSGNIPPASGLSSSSALVSAATLCAAFLYEMPLNKHILASIAATCERYIGTQGGGMDQAIAFLAQKGCAQFIDWNPLTATAVNLPKNVVFVIANSLSEANKAANSDYNQRVVECRIGCRMMAKRLNLPWRDVERFATLQKQLDCTLEQMEMHADSILVKEHYTRQDVMDFFGIGDNEMVEVLLTANTGDMQVFKLRQRALHVFQEAIRVHQFRIEAKTGGVDTVKAMSFLMRASHRSLQHMYECSHPNLDRLVEVSDKLGVSARLTGAGWGGCVVALCDSIDTSHRYIAELQKSYYSQLPQADGREPGEYVFATCPQQGAQVFVDEM